MRIAVVLVLLLSYFSFNDDGLERPIHRWSKSTLSAIRVRFSYCIIAETTNLHEDPN